MADKTEIAGADYVGFSGKFDSVNSFSGVTNELDDVSGDGMVQPLIFDVSCLSKRC